MENYTEEKVKVTVHLSQEAARMLHQYAGDRNRGRFLSDLIVAQRRRDEEEDLRAAEEAAKQAAERSADASRRAREKFAIPTPGTVRKKKRR